TEAVTTERSALSIEERPLYFRSGSENLFGVVTLPTDHPQRSGVILLTGGAWISSVNRNRLWVHAARSLAAAGFHAMRFDYHGVGESSGTLETYGLKRPFIDGTVAAAETLRAQGADRIILLGSCFGARVALEAAAKIDGLDGLILLSPPLGDFERAGQGMDIAGYVGKRSRVAMLRQLADKNKRSIYLRIVKGRARLIATRSIRRMTGRRPWADDWVGPRLLKGVERMVGRKVPILLVYGRDDPFGDEFDLARKGRLGGLVDASEGRIEERILDGQVHKLLDLDVQSDVIRHSPLWAGWLHSRTARTRDAGLSTQVTGG
ncbi:MAG TPA: alpha/beta fold hydrolase, partial [Actinomycetota bacterium]|nr:alpha/beta fold hydrolase [Actinomycetota bacterium]